MIVRVIIPPRLVTAFRRAAVSAYPLEHAEAMRGTVVGDTVTITRFVPIPHKTATSDKVEFYHADAIVGEGDAFVGTIHSHPGEGFDASPSVADWKSAFSCGEIVMGIMGVEPRANGKFKTDLAFYESRPPIAIVHPRIRSPRKRRETINSDLLTKGTEALEKLGASLDTSGLNPVQSKPPTIL